MGGSWRPTDTDLDNALFNVSDSNGAGRNSNQVNQATDMFLGSLVGAGELVFIGVRFILDHIDPYLFRDWFHLGEVDVSRSFKL